MFFFSLLASSLLLAAECNDPPAAVEEDATDLDRMLSNHDYVFLARVDRHVRPGVLAADDVRESAELFVYQPALKGVIPERLAYTLGQSCEVSFAADAVYLVFSNDLSSTPHHSQTRTVMASEDGPSVDWILRWVSDVHDTTPVIQNLADFRWENRILLISDLASDEDVSARMAELEGRAAEIRERDLLWWLVTDSKVLTNFDGRLAPQLMRSLRQRHTLDVPAQGMGSKAITLIGKDGGVKLDARDLDLDRVFARIDSMPMRASELQR